MLVFFGMFLSTVVAGFCWLTQTFEAAGFMDIFSGLIIITIVFYRLISPFIRAAGSDRARRRSGKDNSDG